MSRPVSPRDSLSRLPIPASPRLRVPASPRPRVSPSWYEIVIPAGINFAAAILNPLTSLEVMARASISPADCFASIVAALADQSGVTPPAAAADGKKKFGSNALKIDGKIFAMLVDDRLVVKLPRVRVDALAASGEGIHFDSGGGRVMKEWLSVEGVNPKQWRALADEAKAFVGGKR